MHQVGRSLDRATLEAELARAHRSLFRAKNLAASLGWDGLETDLDMILREVTRLGEQQLSRKPGRGSVGSSTKV